MVSTSSRGSYYKRKTKKYYEDLGYTVQITEFMCATQIKGRCFYRKIDIFGSDMIAINGKEIVFANSKHVTNPDSSTFGSEVSRGKKEFREYPFPKDVKLELVIWQPRIKKPIIIKCNEGK